MTTPTHDEQLVVAALHHAHVTPPDLARLAARAEHQGHRLRRRRQAAVCVAAAAVVAVGSAALAVVAGLDDRTPPASSGTDPTRASPNSPAPTPPITCGPTTPAPASACPVEADPRGLDFPTAYAVLRAPGWSAPADNVVADEKLFYVSGDESLSLNWRPASTYSAKYAPGPPVTTTTIDGDSAEIHGESGDLMVVGPVRDGRFLTLSTSTLTVAELVDLAPLVSRQ